MAFQRNQNVIILSNKEITWTDCITYLRDELKYFRKGSKILILYGIHGTDDGELGEKDESLKLCFEAIPRKIEKKYPEILEKIKIEMFDIGNYVDRSKIDERKLLKSVREKDHSIIFLAFCYTDRSALNDILRSGMHMTGLVNTHGEKIYTPY